MERYEVTVKNHTLHQEQLTAIGLIAAEWSHVEMLIEQTIWAMGKMHMYTGMVVTAHLGSETRLNILEALSYFHPKRKNDEKKHKALVKLIGRIRTLRTERNKIVHAVWMRGKDDKLANLRITAKGKVVLSLDTVTTSELYKLVTDITQLFDDLMAHVKNRRLRLPSSPKKSSPQSFRVVHTDHPNE